jgi:hypothetical protein
MRLLKEREVDQELYEALNFSMRDDEDLLGALDDMLKEDAADVAQTAAVDRAASENEERARVRAAAAEHELQMARHELQAAHEQRITTKKLHAGAKQREEREARVVKALRLHTSRTRKGIVEWAGFKGFADQQLPALQLMAKGGLAAMVAAHKRAVPDARDTEMSVAEAEVI